MKILKIINNTFNHSPLQKMAKYTPDQGFLKKNNFTMVKRADIFDYEKGALKDNDYILMKGIKNETKKILNILNLKNTETAKKLELYENIVPVKKKESFSLHVKHPKIRTITAAIKSDYKGEEYLDFILDGYFGARERYLINENGEIIKKAPEVFATDAQNRTYKTDYVYYTQQEINNLDLNRYFNLYLDEIDKLNKYIKTPQKNVKTAAISGNFWDEYKSKFWSIHEKFEKLYYGIELNSINTSRRKTFSNVCDVKLDNDNPIMQISNINRAGQDAIINPINRGGKKGIRIRLYNNEEPVKNIVLLENRPIEEMPSEFKENLFKLGKIARYYSQNDMELNRIPELLNNIEKRLDDGQQKLRAMIGKKADNI